MNWLSHSMLAYCSFDRETSFSHLLLDLWINPFPQLIKARWILILQSG